MLLSTLPLLECLLRELPMPAESTLTLITLMEMRMIHVESLPMPSDQKMKLIVNNMHRTGPNIVTMTWTA